MNRYESMYILKPNLDEETKASLIERFKSLVEENGGKVEKVDEMGQRKLAYEINYISEGYYVLMIFESPGEFPQELERIYKITENVIRFNVIRL